MRRCACLPTRTILRLRGMEWSASRDAFACSRVNGTARPLSREEAIRYWDDRHRSLGDLRSGGHIGLSEAANEIFYRVRLGKLLELIGNLNAPNEPMFVLDAGCGKGRFSRELAACGFCVDGIDASDAAIAANRDNRRRAIRGVDPRRLAKPNALRRGHEHRRALPHPRRRRVGVERP